MRFVIDAQSPHALAAWISKRGYEAEPVRALGLRDAADSEIWDIALERDAVIVTKDHDFIEWAVTRTPAPQIVWVRLGNVTNRSLTASLDIAWEAIVTDLRAGATVVEVGRA